MPRYRVCKAFTVESGHMLSKHPARCRFPHGHTRRIEVVVASEALDENEMVVDFKALKLAIRDYVERLDHAMALNSQDPLLPALPPESVVIFEDRDPTTEVLAEDLFRYIAAVLRDGWQGHDKGGVAYRIASGAVSLERIRVWETPDSWAEYGD